MPSGEDGSMQQIVNNKEDCESIPKNSTKIKKQIGDCRHQKRQQFDLFEKTARREVPDENSAINEASPKEIEHTWLASTCVIKGDSLITGIDEKGVVRVTY